jgi:hypothetical protein
MDREKLKIAVVELQKSAKYPLEWRIAKYLILAGYSGITDNINRLIQDTDPTLSTFHTNKIWNCMRDIELAQSEKNQYHINNIPDLL